jgi:hypothetical protein
VKIAVFLVFCCFIAESVWAGEFSAAVKNIHIEPVASHYELSADIGYKLSPTAKEALQKGISLTWTVMIKVKVEGVLWDSTLRRIALSYQIQNHALLNSYSVKSLNSGERNMFSTLAGALDFISKIRGLAIIDKHLIDTGSYYYVAVKVMIEREALPTPVRPFSYFDSQWALSSRWILWPLAR